MSEEHDTHGVSGRPWYGFDLDGTLAKYNGWKGIEHIGKPIKPMCDLAKRLHSEGKLIKIVTARVAPNPLTERTVGLVDEEGNVVYWSASRFIAEWCEKHLGFVPEVTHKKDPLMLWLVDDRTVQVEPNTGRILGRLPEEMLLPHCDDAAALALKEANL